MEQEVKILCDQYKDGAIEFIELKNKLILLLDRCEDLATIAMFGHFLVVNQ